MTTPLFSIITVCYNAADTVGRTLSSVASQSFTDYEHIVVDGASTDATLSIIASADGAERRKVISEPDRGIYDAMNKGLHMARGRYLIFMNAGDKFHAHATLAAYADALAAAPQEPGIVYGRTDLVDDEGRYIAPRHLIAPPRLTFADFARGMVVCHQAMAVARSIAPDYDTSYRFSADYEWCLRCLQRSPLNVYIDLVVADYLSEGATTAHRRASLAERLRIMSRYYGWGPTLLRHAGFAVRFIRNRFTLKPSN